MKREKELTAWIIKGYGYLYEGSREVEEMMCKTNHWGLQVK